MAVVKHVQLPSNEIVDVNDVRISGVDAVVTSGSNNVITSGGVYNALGGKQPLDADLTAIAGLTGTSGFLKKTAANTWDLDTSTYLTASTLPARYIGNAAIQSSAQTAQNLGGIGNFTAAGTVSASDASVQALELKPSSASAGNGGYIDFHYNNSSSDYTTRIIENASGTIQILGNAQVTGSLTSGGNQVEVQSNKVTNLSSSSTDTQYPSAKCIYDLIGDIETLINAL